MYYAASLRRAQAVLLMKAVLQQAKLLDFQRKGGPKSVSEDVRTAITEAQTGPFSHLFLREQLTAYAERIASEARSRRLAHVGPVAEGRLDAGGGESSFSQLLSLRGMMPTVEEERGLHRAIKQQVAIAFDQKCSLSERGVWQLNCYT